tara:strand:+ start:6724 stop:7038 length:315 start_codon:yes stop_codon:yes gene_type:complete
VSSDEQFEDEWADFMAIQGLDIEEEIDQEIQANKFRLDMDDGTHAQWDGESLGVLIVFDRGEPEEILKSWEDASRGNLVALTALFHWLESFSFFLMDCMQQKDH